MTRMYVANATLQRHEFIYRIPEETKDRRLTIQPLSQIMLPDELNPEQIASIVEQHERYGFISLTDLKNGKRKERSNLMYSLDRSLSSVAIESLYQANKGIVDAYGRRMREESAIIANDAIVKELDKQRQEQGLEGEVRKVEVTVQEEEPPGGYVGKPIADGFRIEKTPVDNSSRRGRKSGGK